jgi:hypothetical protein
MLVDEEDGNVLPTGELLKGAFDGRDLGLWI